MVGNGEGGMNPSQIGINKETGLERWLLLWAREVEEGLG